MTMVSVNNEAAASAQVGNPLLGQIRDFIDSDEPAPIDPVGMLARAIRGRALEIGLVAIAVAVLFALLAWLAISPGYQSTGVVRILPREAKLLYTDSDDSRLRLYDAFTNAEVHLMQARPVLETAWHSLHDLHHGASDETFTMPKDVGDLSRLISITNRKGLVTVAAKSGDPQLSAAAVNAVLAAYETHKDRARDRVNDVRRSELQEREKQLAANLGELDARYLEIGGEHDMTSLSKAHIAKTAQLEILEERIGELDNTIAQFQRTGAVGADDIRNAEIQRALLLDQAMADMTYERAGRLADLATLRSRYRPTHHKIVTAELELETLEAAIEERRDQITTLGNVGALMGGTSQSSEQSLDELQSVRQKLLERRIVLSAEANELISKLVKIRRVVAEQQRVGKLLDTTKRALDEVIVESQAGRSRSIDVIARGKVPDRPIDDKRKPVAFGAAFFGALATLIGFLLSSLLNPRIRYSDDLKPDVAEKVAVAVPDTGDKSAELKRAGLQLRNEIDMRRPNANTPIVIAVCGGLPWAARFRRARRDCCWSMPTPGPVSRASSRSTASRDLPTSCGAACRCQKPPAWQRSITAISISWVPASQTKIRHRTGSRHSRFRIFENCSTPRRQPTTLSCWISANWRQASTAPWLLRFPINWFWSPPRETANVTCPARWPCSSASHGTVTC